MYWHTGLHPYLSAITCKQQIRLVMSVFTATEQQRPAHPRMPSCRAVQVRDTIDVDDARRSYFTQLFPLNPSGIIPAGPTLADLDLDRPAGRGSQLIADASFSRLQPVAAGSSSS
jgi:hypothetical protein